MLDSPDLTADVRRYSSRKQKLSHSFLRDEIRAAKEYYRIAGYFSSSVFELAGEDLENLEQVRIVCNSDIQQQDWRNVQNRETLLLGSLSSNPALDSVKNQDRYQMLARFLEKHPDSIKVVPDHLCGFLHGKAGLLVKHDGSQLSFIGSMNETYQGWSKNYELLWSDSSKEACDWTREEFDFLWRHGVPLPDAVINEIKRRANRQTVADLNDLEPAELGPAAFVESPLYCEGSGLTPWQVSFVDIVERHYRFFGCARLLLADEVGLGKTFSIGASLVTLALLREQERLRNGNGSSSKPSLIMVPTTLTKQWQTELYQYLGIPTARWDVQSKRWYSPNDVPLSRKGSARQVLSFPYRFGIVPSSVIVSHTDEGQYLRESGDFESFVLDESHKARMSGGQHPEANRLLIGAREIAGKSENVLLATATPMQLSEEDLWDQFSILKQGRGSFIFRDNTSDWRSARLVGDVIRTGNVSSYDEAWRLVSSYVPEAKFYNERPQNDQHQMIWKRYISLLEEINQTLPARQYRAYPWAVDPNSPDYNRLAQTWEVKDLLEALMAMRVGEVSFFQAYNPIINHTVLRKRKDLEDKGLLQKIHVKLHPDLEGSEIKHHHLLKLLFSDVDGNATRAMRGYDRFQEAYEAGVAFAKQYSRDNAGGGFLGSVLLKRICSSPLAGLSTCKKILERRDVESVLDEEDEDEVFTRKGGGHTLSPVALEHLELAVEYLDRSIRSNRHQDKKLDICRIYLNEQKWIEGGCIIFSQYYDTAEWVAQYLVDHVPSEHAIGLYAGGGKSKLYSAGHVQSVTQNQLKEMVQGDQIKLLVATDSACEGLNLQKLKSLINIDLPWNPVKLQQRVGRIKRFGQRSDFVNVLNLVYQGTLDEVVYNRLSERLKNQYDFFGSMPDFLETDWVTEEKEHIEQLLDEAIDGIETTNAFDLHYEIHVEDNVKDWRENHKVIPQVMLREILEYPPDSKARDNE